MNEQEQSADIERLDQAWAKIERSINTFGAFIRNETRTLDALHRFEAYRAALAAVAENFVNQINYDRERPQCMPTLSRLFNYGGPSADFVYFTVHLEPGASYRVWGRRGDALMVDFQEVDGWFGQHWEGERKKSVTLANRVLDDLGVTYDETGNFDFILSPKKHEGQWVELNPRTSTIVIRQYFTDYAKQSNPMGIYFDKLGGSTKTSALTIDEGLERLEHFANSLKDWQYCFNMPGVHAASVGDNMYRVIDFGDDVGTCDQHYFQVRFNIPPNQALIGKWELPEDYLYFSTSLNNDAYEALNCGYRQTNLNHELAKLGNGRVFYFVLSHQDPGIANWLDLDGHQQGLMLTRIKGRNGKRPEKIMPSLTLVPFDAVLSHLPKDIAMVTQSERAAALAIRQRHFHLRDGR